MGFFSKLFASEPSAFTIPDEREAYASILLACICSDGDMSDEEQNSLTSLLMSRPFFASVDFGRLVERAFGHFRKTGGGAALVDAAAGAIQEPRKLPLFTTCVDLVLSDGQVTSEEEAILDYLKKKFSVDDSYASKAVEVLLVKNKV